MAGSLEASLELRQVGFRNMELDLALFEAAHQGHSGLRVYTWESLWVTIGRFQDPAETLVNPDAWPWTRRPTGGGGVLHGHDVTLGAAFPLSSLGIAEGSRSVAAIYRAVITPIVSALRQIGVEAVLGEESRFGAKSGIRADCFVGVSPNDVVNPSTGQKVVGCALRVSPQAVLLQASLPAGPPLADPASIFRESAPAAWSRGLEAETFFQAIQDEFGAVLSRHKGDTIIE